MNKIILILSIFLSILLYKFTNSDTSYSEYNHLKNEIIKLEKENTEFLEKIKVLKAKIENLKTGLGVIEEKARNELGLIKEKETFFQILK